MGLEIVYKYCYYSEDRETSKRYHWDIDILRPVNGRKTSKRRFLPISHEVNEVSFLKPGSAAGLILKRGLLKFTIEIRAAKSTAPDVWQPGACAGSRPARPAAWPTPQRSPATDSSAP